MHDILTHNLIADNTLFRNLGKL